MAPDVKSKVIRDAMVRNFAPRTIDVQSRVARAPRRLALNFRQLAVPINTTVDLPARPQLPFRPERLFVQSDIAGNFEIVDIIIGNRSQFAQATPMSARIAAETSFGFDLHMDTAMVAMDVVLRIANITGAERFPGNHRRHDCHPLTAVAYKVAFVMDQLAWADRRRVVRRMQSNPRPR
jgi:hypothetical protein